MFERSLTLSRTKFIAIIFTNWTKENRLFLNTAVDAVTFDSLYSDRTETASLISMPESAVRFSQVIVDGISLLLLLLCLKNFQDNVVIVTWNIEPFKYSPKFARTQFGIVFITD